jgi:hypothetical protein
VIVTQADGQHTGGIRIDDPLVHAFDVAQRSDLFEQNKPEPPKIPLLSNLGL